jgi:membrane protein YqaA with SNARE-associated domain
MKRFIDTKKEKIAAWLVVQAQSRHAWWILGLLSIVSSIIPPAPPDVIFIPMVLAHRKRWFLIGTFAIVMSTVGAVLAYIIGAGLFDVVGKHIINFYGLTEKFAQVGLLYEQHSFLSVFSASFTPVPDTVFTIGAGLFRISLPLFALAYFLGRVLRIYPEVFLTYLYGPIIAKVVYKYFNIISLILIAVVIAVLLLV